MNEKYLHTLRGYKRINKSTLPIVVDCCHNILCGNVPCEVQDLEPFEDLLKQILDKKLPLADKKRLFTSTSRGRKLAKLVVSKSIEYFK